MHRKQISQTTAPSVQKTAAKKQIVPTPSYEPLSSAVQRVQQDPKSVSEDERQQLESAIGSRSTRQILAGKQTSWIPDFTGISQQFWGDSGQAPIQAKRMDDVGISETQPENKTGLQDQLKAGIENLSGMAMDDVRVHYNSSKPAELQALAYTQGTDIHVAPGQEKHLPHEAWHVIQQKQGRVKPTMQMMGVGINDDVELERESDLMGKKANAVPYSKADDSRPKSIPFARDEKNQTKMIYLITEETGSQKVWTTGLNKINTHNQPIQCQFSERIDSYMVLVNDSALRHLTEQQMRFVIAQPAFILALNQQYGGFQVDDFTIRVDRVRLQVNIYPAGNRPPVVEVYHADAGYQAENRQKAIDRWNKLNS